MDGLTTRFFSEKDKKTMCRFVCFEKDRKMCKFVCFIDVENCDRSWQFSKLFLIIKLLEVL